MTESSLKMAESQLNAAQNAFALARQQREIAEQRMQESIAAVNIVELSAFGQLAYENAGKELVELRAKQAEQYRLEMEMVRAEKKKIEIDGKREVACSQASVFARQQQEREAERATIRGRIEAIQTHLRISEPEFEREKNLANRASGWLSDIRHVLSSFADLLAHGEAALSRMKEIAALRAATDLFAVEKARNRERAADAAFQIVRQRLAAANAEYSALKRQLEEIGGGICPLLKEQCRQFDPSKVAGDLKEKSATIETLEEKRRIAESELYAAQAEHEQQRQEENNLAVMSRQLEQTIADFSSALKRLTRQSSGEAVDGLRLWIQQLEAMPACPESIFGRVALDAFEEYHRQVVAYLADLQKWWQGTCFIVQDRIDTVQREEGRRNADRRDELNFTENLVRIEAEIEKLAIARNKQLETAIVCSEEIAGLAKTIESLDEQRRALGFFGDQIVLLEQTQQKFRADYERFLEAKSLADEQRSREIDLNVRREQEQHASEQLRFCEAKVVELGRAFDPATLKATRGKYQEINAAVAMEWANLNNARRELEREESRFSQWQEACATREKIIREVRRLEAGIELAELARTILRDSAPAVAQHLCHRIAGRAQQIFNQINHDPVELKWEAAPRYSLRIIPGDRRFAMLSGGEQTKLALAMTLAMIQELSGLRFCIFDEPTYGVDAESREKLGEVMLDAQKAADLEQLILVSHDGAFDGKIEHSIFLRKTATHGTEVVQAWKSGPPAA
jgi:exonuclease SbcC